MAVQTGSGGELRSADGLHHVKMSVVDRKLSMPKLIKKWGPWTAPAPPEHRFIPRIIDPERAGAWATRDQHRADACGIIQERSEERRVGKECVSTVKSRGSPYH